jgi:undecaprenyl-diphosphatase
MYKNYSNKIKNIASKILFYIFGFREVCMKYAFYDWFGFNSWLAILINSHRDYEYIDIIFSYITLLGENEYVPVYLVIFAIYSIYLYVRSPIENKKTILYKILGFFVIVTLAIFFRTIIVFFMKKSFAYPRPFIAIPEYIRAMGEEVSNNFSYYRSFPSGHASLIAVIVCSLWPIVKKWQRFIMIYLMILVIYSRVYFGLHFPADVICGMLIGAVSVQFAAYLNLRFCDRMLVKITYGGK